MVDVLGCNRGRVGDESEITTVLDDEGEPRRLVLECRQALPGREGSF